jgi:hypothetical protein
MMHDAIGHGYVRVRKVVAVASVINESRPVVGSGSCGTFRMVASIIVRLSSSLDPGQPGC